MQIDIIKLAEIVGAYSIVIWGIIGGYKLYNRLHVFGSKPSHTYKERFDKLKKMANLHRLDCIT